MAALNVTFNSNLDEVLRDAKSATAKALMEIGIAVQRDAASNSPVRTGALRGSWTVEVNEEENYVIIGVPQDALEGNYAKYVELGTSKQGAKHMLRNAVEQNKDKIKKIVETEFKNA